MSFYTWYDPEYSKFMVELLENLHPRIEPANTIILKELDEQNEVIFIEDGAYKVGFEINHM